MKAVTKNLIEVIAESMEWPLTVTRVDKANGALLVGFPGREALASFMEWVAADRDAPAYAAIFRGHSLGAGWRIVAVPRDISGGEDTMLDMEYEVLIPALHHAQLLKWLSGDFVEHRNKKVSRQFAARAEMPPPVPRQMDEDELLDLEIGLDRVLEDLTARGLREHTTTVQLEKVRLALLALYAELGVREPTPCDDCGVDVYAINEGFMLRDEVWQSAGGNRFDSDLGQNAHGAAHLCIGCVERRLGRRLTREDFEPFDAVPQIHDSDRVADRKGGRPQLPMPVLRTREE